MWECVLGPNEWCTEDSPCFSCEERLHLLMHPKMDQPDCRTCKMRSINLDPSTVTPSSKNQIAPAGNGTSNNWEKGFVTDRRGMPYLDAATGNPISCKRFANNRSAFEESIRRNRNEVPA